MSDPIVVRRVAVAPDCLAVMHLPRVDFSDAFAVDVHPDLPRDPAFWLRRLLGDPPPLVVLALGARNAVMGRMGLKTGAMIDMPVLARTGEELVIGLDDTHLDFRLAVRVTPGPQPVLRATTTVRFNGAAGRLYFLPVRPVHGRLVVPGMLRRAGRLTPADAGSAVRGAANAAPRGGR